MAGTTGLGWNGLGEGIREAHFEDEAAASMGAPETGERVACGASVGNPASWLERAQLPASHLTQPISLYAPMPALWGHSMVCSVRSSALLSSPVFTVPVKPTVGRELGAPLTCINRPRLSGSQVTPSSDREVCWRQWGISGRQCNC